MSTFQIIPLNWQAFLSACEVGLEQLDARLAQFAAGVGAAPVVFDPGRIQASPNDCLVGIGRHWQPRTGDGRLRLEHQGFCLNDKGLETELASAAAGVSALVLAPPARLWVQWQHAADGITDPAAFFARFTLVVEDASADGCLGVILLLARLAGVAVEEIPNAWTRYVAAWERGASRTADPYRAWGPLLSALTHGYLDASLLQEPITEFQTLAHDLALGQAWLAGLRLTLAALRAGSPPEPLAELPACPELGQAVAALRLEEQLYQQAIAHAECVQLRLPLAGPGGRWRLVDAVVLEEFALTGAMKILLRNDRTRAWLGDGFGLLALSRPALVGSGDDMTISVDPATGTQLKALWMALEVMEDAAGARDTQHPRPLAAYPEGRRADGTPSPTQPWWDDRGSYTLIAAPRRLPDGTPGTRLIWNQVLETLWDCYRPDHGLLLADAKGIPRPLNEHQSTQIPGTNQQLLVLYWPRPDVTGLASGALQQTPILLTPTHKRLLGACIANATLAPEVRWQLAHLPTLDALDVLPLTGGYAVVHADGVLLLDDWRSEPLDICAGEREVEQSAERMRFLHQESAAAEALIDRLGGRIRNGRLPAAADGRALAGLTLRLQHCLNATTTDCDDPHLRALREALERRWRIAGRLTRFAQALSELDAAISTAAQQRTARLINALTLFGFPLALWAGFFNFSFLTIPRDWAAVPDWLFGVGDQGPHWPALALFVLLSIFGMLLIGLAVHIVRGGVNRKTRNTATTASARASRH